MKEHKLLESNISVCLWHVKIYAHSLKAKNSKSAIFEKCSKLISPIKKLSISLKTRNTFA